MRSGRVMGLLLAGFIVAGTLGGTAWSAPCVKACKDEISACSATDCQALPTKKQRKACQRRCKKSIMSDCLHGSLETCGATTARPAAPAASSGSSGGSSGGGGGGW